MADYPVTEQFSGGDYGRSATASAQPFRGIVVHVTGRPTLQSEMDYMSKPDPNRPGYYGYHYLIDRNGSIYQTAPFTARTNHIMPSSQYGLNNSNALGIAMVGGDKGMTPDQIAAGKQLVPQLQQQFNIPSGMVVSHGMLDPETRGPGHGLGVDNTAEGQQFITAFRGAQPTTAAAPGTTINTTTGPARPVTATPGATFTSPMDLVAQVESGNRNIPQQIKDRNTAQGTPAGGYFQIIDPTWARYAPGVGVDLKQFPNALSAPREVQAKVASAIPVNQWGQNTVAALQKQYPGIDTSKTLGEVQSAALGGAPSGSAVASAAPTTYGTTLAGFSPEQNFTKNLNLLDKGMGGKGNLGQTYGADQGEEDMRPSPMLSGPGARNVSALGGLMLPYSATLQQSLLQRAQTPMQWGSQTPGQPLYAQAGLQQQQPYGTSLAGLQQLHALTGMGDPDPITGNLGYYYGT